MDASEITALRCFACFLCTKSKKSKGMSTSKEGGASTSASASASNIADKYIDIPFFIVEAPVSSRNTLKPKFFAGQKNFHSTFQPLYYNISGNKLFFPCGKRHNRLLLSKDKYFSHEIKMWKRWKFSPGENFQPLPEMPYGAADIHMFALYKPL